MAAKEPLLTDYELMDPAVMKILKYFDDKLAKLRVLNDDFEADISIRGEIANIKAFQKALYPKKSTTAKEINSAL